MEKDELKIVINQGISHRFWASQHASWIYFHYETTSFTGRKRQTIAGELPIKDIPEFVQWLLERK